MNKVQKGYEVAEYSASELDAAQAYQVIRQIFFDKQKISPSWGVWADMTGDVLKIHYHSYEMFLPTRMKEINDRANDVLKNVVKYIKDEFKSRTGKTLKLVEKKESANHSVEKVSLNERYYVKYWRFYTLSW